MMQGICAQKRILTIHCNSNKQIATWGILLFLVLCFPRMMQIIKILLCIVIFGLNFLYGHSISISKRLVKFLAPWFLYAFITIGMGFFYQNTTAGILAFTRVNVVNVLLFSLITMSIVKNEWFYSTTIAVCVYSTIYISLYNLSILLLKYLGFNISFLQHLDATAAVGLHTSYTHLVSTNLSMSIILFPLLIMLINDTKTLSIIDKRLLLCSIILCAITMVLSGRRILWGSLIGGIAALLFSNINNVRRFVRYFTVLLALSIIGIIIASSFGLLSINGLIERLKFAFTDYDEFGLVNVRDVQREHLLKAFLQRPILGSGAGATISNYQRSATSPWTFELSYHVVLFQSGLLGAFLYCCALISILRTIFTTYKYDKKLRNALLLMYTVALIANETNPYFSSSFDFMIFLYMPLMISIHISYVDREELMLKYCRYV